MMKAYQNKKLPRLNFYQVDKTIHKNKSFGNAEPNSAK